MRSPTPDQQRPGAEDDVDLATRPTEVVDVTVRPTVRLPRPRPATMPPGGRAPLAVAAGAAAFIAALTSYTPVVVAMWLARLTEGGGFGALGGAAKAGLGGWLLAHGVPIGTSAGTFGLVPLGLSVFTAWRVARAGVHACRAVGARNATPRQVALIVCCVGLAYGLIGAFAALAVDAAGLHVSAIRAFLTLTLFGALGALVGALRSTGALRFVVLRVHPVLRDGIRTGVVAAALVAGAGAAAAGLAVALGGGDAGALVGAYRTGVAGQAGITLISVAYAPNAAVWASAYLLGPGFAVGADTTVRATEVTVGGLPALPLVAGIPHGPVGGLGAVFLAIPVVAAMVAGWMLARRALRLRAGDVHARHRSWAALLSGAAFGGPVAGLLLGAAAVASAGPLGDGRLAEIGPVGWQVAAVGAAVVAVGAMAGAAATRALAGP
jgi:hypothetical protein